MLLIENYKHLITTYYNISHIFIFSRQKGSDFDRETSSYIVHIYIILSQIYFKCILENKFIGKN